MITSVLDTIDPRQLGKELQEARKKRGITQEEAAKVIEVARTTLTAIEKGERQIKPAELIKLADVYDRQVSDFVRGRPVIQRFQVQFRGPYHVTEKETGDIQDSVAIMEELCRDYLELEEILDAPPMQNYPREYRISGIFTEQAVESIAIEERHRLSLGDRPVPILRDILEQEVGLRIFYLALPSKFSEIYHYDQNVGGCIVINKQHPAERRRLSLAHGYAHFLVHRHKPGTFVESDYQRMPEDERLADMIAFYLLMPSSSVVRQYNALREEKKKITVVGLCMIASYFGVSVEAITRRLEDMKLVPTGIWDKIQDSGLKIRDLQEQFGINETRDRDDVLPARYKYLAYAALDRGLITEAQFSKFLRIDRIQAREFAQGLRQQEGLADGDGNDMDSSHVVIQ